jgi:hypothetical protein
MNRDLYAKKRSRISTPFESLSGIYNLTFLIRVNDSIKYMGTPRHAKLAWLRHSQLPGLAEAVVQKHKLIHGSLDLSKGIQFGVHIGIHIPHLYRLRVGLPVVGTHGNQLILSDDQTYMLLLTVDGGSHMPSNVNPAFHSEPSKT